jgi:hypothetical protein
MSSRASLSILRRAVGLLLAGSLAGCATTSSPYFWVDGTASFTATAITPRAKDEAGAVPVRALNCDQLAVGGPMNVLYGPPLVRLGEGCILSPGHTGDTCDLPTERLPLRIVVKSLSLNYTTISAGRTFYSTLPLEVVVGGVTVEGGRYVTYRFTGTAVAGDATTQECRAVATQFHSQDPPPPPQREVIPAYEVDLSSWRSGQLCTAQGCAP